MALKFYQNKDFLYREYVRNRKSITQIAKEQDVSYQTIQNYVEKFGFKTQRGKKR